jgi:hypothetical protein
MKKIKSKSTAYPLLQVFIVIVIFLSLNLWSIGDFENYKKISEFKNGLLSKDFKFKQFPPNEFFGVKLYDDFEKYLLVNKSEIDVDEINNSKYYDIREKEIKSINPLPEYFDDTKVIANENGEIVGILTGVDITLYNNNNFLNFCTKTRNSFLKQHNLSRLNFNKEYYVEDEKEYYDESYDFKNFDLQINNNNARFSIVCGYDINQSSIKYMIILFLYDINFWKDIMIEEEIKITSKKFSNNDIRKYRNKKNK